MCGGQRPGPPAPHLARAVAAEARDDAVARGARQHEAAAPAVEGEREAQRTTEQEAAGTLDGSAEVRGESVELEVESNGQGKHGC